jgi:hypothetical protein
MKTPHVQFWKAVVVAVPIIALGGSAAVASLKAPIFRDKLTAGFPPLIEPYRQEGLKVAVQPIDAADKPKQDLPQGEDPPSGATPTPGENGGVIVPPATGDEGIHTQVPDPNAGTDRDVISPPAAQQSR